MKAHGSAPTKAILIGEHVGAGGGSAIAVPLLQHKTHVFVAFSDVDIIQSNYPMPPGALDWALSFLWEQLDLPRAAINAEVQCGLPVGSGGGMSASLIVALVRALWQLHNVPILSKKLIEIVSKTEARFHGKSSGIDHMTIINELPVQLQNGQFSVCNYSLPPFRLVFTGKPDESTAQMVDHVSRWKDNNRVIFEHIVQQSGQCAEQLKTEPIEAMNTWGECLEQIGIMPQRVSDFCKQLRVNGYGAKVTGAGGLTGGAGFVIVAGSGAKPLSEMANEYGFSVM